MQALVPSLVLAASMALPVGASPQTAPPLAAKSASLRAAMAEAHRIPFDTMSSVEGLTIFGPAGVSVSRVGDRPDPDSARGPSFHRVFWPTLGGTLLSEFAFLYILIQCDLDSGNPDGCTDAQWARQLLFATATLVAGPPTVARIAGASFTKGLLGSAAGLGLGWGLFRLGLAAGLDDSYAFWAIPTTHAFLTTLVSRL